MGRRRDPEMLTGHVCRFCGEGIAWGAILRVLRTDPGQPGYLQKESACHAECLARVLRPEVPLAFARHWNGKAPLPDDAADIAGAPCAICAEPIAPARVVRLRIQRPTGTVKAPEFDEQSLALHADCLAAVSLSRLG
jgi:hypothetical protein